MKTPLLYFSLSVILLTGCQTLKPASVAVTKPLFPEPTDFQRKQLDALHARLEGPVAKLDLSWVSDMGAVAIPKLLQLAGDKTLPAPSRNLALVVLGNTMRTAQLRDQPDARNNVIVPVLREALGSDDANLRGNAAYACRFIDDPQLVPALERLLQDEASTQEQGVLALGINGDQRQVVAIMQLFFATDNGTFRYSCLYALSTLVFYRDVDVAGRLRSNAGVFGASHAENVASVSRRFDEFQQLARLIRQLQLPDVAAREEACAALRQLEPEKLPCNPQADAAGQLKIVQTWHDHLLRTFWRRPAPGSSSPAR